MRVWSSFGHVLLLCLVGTQIFGGCVSHETVGNGVVQLEEGDDASPPSPDGVQQANALERSGNSAMVAKAQSAAAKASSATSTESKNVASQTAVAKAQSAGADTSQVSAQATSTADAKSLVTTSGADDSTAKKKTGGVNTAFAAAVTAAAANALKQVKSQSTKAGLLVNDVPAASSPVNGLPANGVPVNGGLEVDPHLPRHAYTKFQRMTVKSRPLMMMKGTLLACKNACSRALKCRGVEFSKNHGGVCILLADGVRWSNQFDYFEKKSPEASDPASIARNDDKLMWGGSIERDEYASKALGLSSAEIPEATVYKPPTKAELARKEIQKLYQPIKQARFAAAAAAKNDLEYSKNVQSKLVMALGETQHLQRETERKQQEMDKRESQVAMQAAKKDVLAAKLAAKATAEENEYQEAQSKAKDYTDASMAFTAAGNPMAASMVKKSHRWTAKAKSLKLAVQKLKTSAALVKTEAAIADANKEHLKQQAQWAFMDELKASKHLATASQMTKSANDIMAKKRKKAKELDYKANCQPDC